MTIPEFVHELATAVPPPNCANPYGYERPFAAPRRHNLQLYLELMIQQQPKQLLIGEAPGYRGCRQTGIPFVSLSLLDGLIERFPQADNPFQPVGEWQQIRGEASATILWRTVGSWQPLPLLWNVFPFHPHQPGQPQSNRTPTAREIEAGRPFLTHLLHLFPSVSLIAVGQKAAGALARWGWAHSAVRHPSQGGARAFAAALSVMRQA
ncbi:MAG: uracil-DNA glycosylase [Anaerolineaceae bacterium]|nr:uracil-DNA glycosylase [Anaerolineaceae bacterium]